MEANKQHALRFVTSLRLHGGFAAVASLRRLFDVVWTGRRTRNKRRSARFYTESLDFLIASKTLF